MRFENTKILWTMLINRKGCHMIAMTKLKWHLGITEQFYILGLDKEVVICVGKREKERGGGGGSPYYRLSPSLSSVANLFYEKQSPVQHYGPAKTLYQYSKGINISLHSLCN
jgi:hypothetical protein